LWRRALTANEAKGIFVAGAMSRDLTMAATATITAKILVRILY